ncbi:hypothetical protein GGR50DRAFT_168312 [Xylaria sp. CBS 124048]|nr:hypothetical protein GGR50DRAFT_168312 [Xylaria sp. CBS 124048]
MSCAFLPLLQSCTHYNSSSSLLPIITIPTVPLRPSRQFTQFQFKYCFRSSKWIKEERIREAIEGDTEPTNHYLPTYLPTYLPSVHEASRLFTISRVTLQRPACRHRIIRRCCYTLSISNYLGTDEETSIAIVSFGMAKMLKGSDMVEQTPDEQGRRQ